MRIARPYTIAVALVAVVLATTASAQHTAAQWVWYPEDASHDCYKDSRWFRASFELDAAPVEANLWLLVDDRQTLWVNGEGPLESVERREASLRYDLTGLLTQGRNVFAIEGWNGTSVAGVIARLTVKLADDREVIVNSDDSWRASREAPEGWTEPDFDDTAWQPAQIIGDAFTAPWIGIPAFHMPVFYTDEEAAARARYVQTLLAPADQFADDPPADARVKWVNDMPAIVINGKPRPVIFYRGTPDPMREHGRRQIGIFRDAGIHMFNVYTRMRKCWTAPGEYDFSSVDEEVRAYLAVDPDAYLVVMVRLIQPSWWADAHPDEMVGYGSGDEYGGGESDRPKRGSLASQQWLDDTGEAWQALIRHVEAQPWGKRVIGYQPAYGISAEWHYFGSWHDNYPDTGAAMTRTFRSWLREKYGTDAALRAAWNNPQASFETATVPTMADRIGADLFAFRDPTTEQRIIDYYHCHQKVVADDIDYLARIVKDETDAHKLCGVYYGYFFGVRPQTQGGHLELPTLFASPNVDYFVAPYSYSQRLMGQDGRLRGLAGAFRLAGKLHILEGDIRTWLHSRDEYGRTQNREQSLAAIAREFSTSLIERAGFWYVDFGPGGDGGWFDDPAVMAQATALRELAERALEQPREETAQIALVCDLESPYYLSDGEGMKIAYRMIEGVTTELHHIGAPFDAIHLDQLDDADLERYRMIVFLNTVAMTDDQAARIAELRRAGQHAMVFLWAPGLTGPDGISTERASLVTGMHLNLVAEWLPGVIDATGDDPLLDGLPSVEVQTMQVTDATPVPGFDAAANWYNPRTAQVMEKQYSAFEFEAIEGGLRWVFDTVANYSDIHCNFAMDQADGIGYDLRLEGEASWLTARLAIKDANWAEFVSPTEVIVPGIDYRFEYPFTAFENAPWSKLKPEEIAFPLNGCKVVLSETANAGRCVLEMTNLRALTGTITEHTTRRFGEGSFAPALVPVGDGVRILGTLAGTEYTGLIADGSGRATTVFCSAPFIPREVLANLADEAGVHRYLDTLTDVVRADARFVAIHTKEGGPRTLNLPTSYAVTDALTGVAIGSGSHMPLVLPPDSTTILELTP